jgi:hypothetical protein
MLDPHNAQRIQKTLLDLIFAISENTPDLKSYNDGFNKAMTNHLDVLEQTGYIFERPVNIFPGESNPDIPDCKELAKKYKKDKIAIFHFDKKNGQQRFGFASYGTNKKECAEAFQFANSVFNTLMKVTKGKIIKP